MTDRGSAGLRAHQRVLKRAVDLAAALVLLVPASIAIGVLWILASRDTGRSGIFTQQRIGRDGRPFTLFKIRTMRDVPGNNVNATAGNDPRITDLGRRLRRYKLDELPQLYNVLRGQMSLVGPRPEVPGYADRLVGDDRLMLTIRPGITGPATLAFRDEEELLAAVEDPQRFNDEVLFPTKVRINNAYVSGYRVRDDLRCLWLTATGGSLPRPELPQGGFPPVDPPASVGMPTS